MIRLWTPAPLTFLRRTLYVSQGGQELIPEDSLPVGCTPDRSYLTRTAPPLSGSRVPADSLPTCPLDVPEAIENPRPARRQQRPFKS